MDDTRSGAPIGKDVDKRAFFNVFASQHGRQLRDTDAEQRRAPQLCDVVGDEARRVGNTCRCTIRPFQLPDMLAVRWSKANAW